MYTFQVTFTPDGQEITVGLANDSTPIEFNYKGKKIYFGSLIWEGVNDWLLRPNSPNTYLFIQINCFRGIYEIIGFAPTPMP